MSKSIHCIVCNHEIAKWCFPQSSLCPRCDTENDLWISLVCSSSNSIAQKVLCWPSRFLLAVAGLLFALVIAISTPIIITLIWGIEDSEPYFAALVMGSLIISYSVTCIVTRNWSEQLFRYREQYYSVTKNGIRWYASPIVKISLLLILATSLGPIVLYYIIPVFEVFLNSDSDLINISNIIRVVITNQNMQDSTDIIAITWMVVIVFLGASSFLMSYIAVDKFIKKVNAEINKMPIFGNDQKMKKVLSEELQRKGYHDVEWVHVSRQTFGSYDWTGVYEVQSQTMPRNTSRRLQRKIIVRTDLYCNILEPIFTLDVSGVNNSEVLASSNGNINSTTLTSPVSWRTVWIDHPARKTLYSLIKDCFSLSELKSICFTLGINTEQIQANTLEDMARELIEFQERRDRTQVVRLVDECRNQRPTAKWPEIP